MSFHVNVDVTFRLEMVVASHKSNKEQVARAEILAVRDAVAQADVLVVHEVVVHAEILYSVRS